jgi:hypothetical protein
MDEKTRSALARIAVQWHKTAQSNRRRANGQPTPDNAAMSPIALRHRRYQQLIRLRKAG